MIAITKTTERTTNRYNEETLRKLIRVNSLSADLAVLATLGLKICEDHKRQSKECHLL